MNDAFALPDAESIADLTVFLSRARRIDDQAVRVTARDGVLLVTCAVLYPRGILDPGPAVLGLRSLRETHGAAFDRVVQPAAMLERLARAGEAAAPLTMPPGEVRAAWAGVAPPKGGWARIGEIDAEVLAAAARAGAGDIAAALPDAAGDHVVQRVRSQVWSQPIRALPALPAGAAFAADALGFLVRPETVPVFESGQWLRISPRRGHVLVHRRSSMSAEPAAPTT